MKSLMYGLAAMLLAASMSTQSQAALIYSGSELEFTGPGTYTVDIFATAVGQQEEIGGYNFQMDFAGVGVQGTPTLIGIPTLNTFPTVFPLGGTSFGFSAFASPLPANAFVVADGATEAIAQIQFEATTPGVIAWDEQGTLAFDENNAPIALTFSSTTPALTVTAIPEPSSLLALGCLGLIGGVVVRRRKRSV